MADSRRILKIAITATGQISADGLPTTLEALIPMLRELAKSKGEFGIIVKHRKLIRIRTR